MLGIIALLLGFTFSQALGRYEARSIAVVDEANAIGTAVLRADLVPDSARNIARTSLRDYLQVRTEAAVFPVRSGEWEDLTTTAEKLHAKIWSSTQQVVGVDDGPIASLYVQSINEVIDSYGRRKAEILRHVPPLANLLLISSFLLCCFAVGISAGLGKHRPPITSYMLILLVVLSMFVVIDLDRPRRGPIQVPRESLHELGNSVLAGDSLASAVSTR